MGNNIIELGLVERNGKAVVSRRDIARVFEKEHRHVLRSIREINCTDDFRVSNFGQSTYRNEQGHETPEYLLTRDGFTLIVMGYTGDKAMRLVKIDNGREIPVLLCTPKGHDFIFDLVEREMPRWYA